MEAYELQARRSRGGQGSDGSLATGVCSPRLFPSPLATSGVAPTAVTKTPLHS